MFWISLASLLVCLLGAGLLIWIAIPSPLGLWIANNWGNTVHMSILVILAVIVIGSAIVGKISIRSR